MNEPIAHPPNLEPKALDTGAIRRLRMKVCVLQAGKAIGILGGGVVGVWILLMFACSIASPLLFVLGIRHSDRWLESSFGYVIGAAFTSAIILGLVTGPANRHRGTLRLIEARSDAREFHLLLRPFDSPLTHAPQDSSLENGALYQVRIVPEHRYEDVIFHAIAPERVVYLLGRDEELMVERSSGAVPIRCPPGVEWRDAIAILIRGSRAIFVMPENSPGIAEELGMLMTSGNHRKALIVMPPPARDSDEDRAARWEAVRKTLFDRCGCELPEYVPSGGVYLADARLGTNQDMARLDSDRPEAFAAALRQLVSRLPAGEPLTRCISEIESLANGSP